MASPLASDFVDRVRAAVDIVALISESVPLKKVGRKHRGLCPFHPEKTPSFYVDEAKGLFYCFGCQTGGDAFKFLMLKENVEFLEAARHLARRLGIPVAEARPGRSSEREALLGAHRAAADFYHDTLRTGPDAGDAREYLRARGISDETIVRLKIGFAPDRWDALKSRLVSRGFAASLLVTGGLLAQKQEGAASSYDRFRNRVIFPIRNLSGDVVGFGGRVIGKGDPKYLNSAETPIYNKRANLYGLDVTRDGIRQAGEAVVVEGYLDFATLLQAGVDNVVATLGTAFTEDQAVLLRRFTRRAVINYDPDAAGASATRRSLELLLSHGFSLRALELESGLDPDEFVRRRGPQAYRSRLDEAPRYFDYLIRKATLGKDLSDFEVKSAVLRDLLPIMSQVPDRIERSGYVNLLAEKLAVEDAILLAEIRDALMRDGGATRVRPPRSVTAPSLGAPGRLFEAEGRLLRALLESRDVRCEVLQSLSLEDLAGSPIEEMVRAIESLSHREEEVSYSALVEMLQEPARSLLAGLAMRPEPLVTREEALRCVDSIRLRRLRQVRDHLQKEMEREIDAARLDELMRRKMEVSRRIDSLA